MKLRRTFRRRSVPAVQKPTVTVPDSDPPTSLEVVDDVVGDGSEASPGNTVSVHYVGVAWSTGSQFGPRRGTGWSRSDSGSAVDR